MTNRLPIPEDLQHLIEKRSGNEQREVQRRGSATEPIGDDCESELAADERRKADERRQASRRESDC